jgi:hypothetical protein
VFVDPDHLNIPAIRAFEKSGFKKLVSQANKDIILMSIENK